MQRHAHHALFAIMIAGSCLAGCAEPAATAPGFYVPTTMLHQSTSPDPEPATALAYQVLPGADDDIFFVGRAEKGIYTALPLSEISAFSIFTYDAHRISGPNESGYRYSYMVREGVFAP
jgi:hypothetical protein